MKIMEHKLTKILIWYWFPIFLYLGIIFAISSIPNLEIPIKVRFADKFVHTFEYAILGYLLMRALCSTRRISLRTSTLLNLFFILIWGISDEIYQGFVPGRTSSISDLVFNLLGGAIGRFFYSRKW